jgi:antitoxin HicB
MKSPRVGSSFESFLDEVGIKAEVQDLARKRVSDWQLEEEKNPTGLSKGGTADRSGTRRSHGDKL